MMHTGFSKRIMFVGIILGALAGLFVGATESRGQDSVPPEQVAAHVHAVIEADRSLYTEFVVERLQQAGKVIASRHWKNRSQLPLPAQMLMFAGLEVEGMGSGLKYRLASLWPLEEENGPANDFEKAGLEVVADDPSEVYSGMIKRGKQKYFKAIYADKAVSQSCVECHNGHLLSPKRDYKLGDVMGGVIISFPVDDAISLEQVAAYVHAVIEADRTLYTKLVVERMQQAGIVLATQNWKKYRSQLPLPAQMLLLAGLEVEGMGSGLKYRLASLWPLEEENGPANDFEKAGLEVVADDPSEVYSGMIKRGKQKYFKAIYADKAVSQSCVECHNGHLLSSKRDFKLGDVMGGVIISFPIE
ncbi:MAG: hypothetical protein NPIRA02_11750 [Nitrospirales bacterium]|nr:MAG: hypothetical protein NPIRA02_11750 [Nitrospirales bacterium]